MISTLSTTTANVAAPQVMEFSLIAAVVFIAFLALKQISIAELGGEGHAFSFNNGSSVALIPLLMTFLAITAYALLNLK
ncbi:MAG TPA: hypothetical protein VK444_00320 [Methanobacteriaceae archaeon]|nr:hypothetical protein [Methanobacteriaceae archaeon]